MRRRSTSRTARRLRARRARHLRRPRPIRILVALTGAVITLSGLLLLVLPGPALVVIPIGLALLALEFTWAERALERAIAHTQTAKDRAAATSRTQRLLGFAAAGLAVAAAVAAALVWDIPVVPV